MSKTQSDELEIRLPKGFSTEHKDAVLRFLQESSTFSLTKRGLASFHRKKGVPDMT